MLYQREQFQMASQEVRCDKIVHNAQFRVMLCAASCVLRAVCVVCCAMRDVRCAMCDVLRTVLVSMSDLAMTGTMLT